jgi:ParB-like chromosome segregation protein Spo0J
MDLEFHPLANCLPLIEGPEFDELVADIKERGLALPIELYDGKILDGRNRYRACLRLGIEPLIVTYAGADPAARVTSLNLRRRHLTASQRAMAAAKMANMRSGARTDLGHSLSEVSIKRAADLHKVGTTSVKQAHTVLRDGTLELVPAVEGGSIPVKRAAEIARQPSEQQREAMKAPTAAAKRASALPKVAARKPERAPWQTVRATKGAKHVTSATSTRCCGSSASKSSPCMAAQAGSCGTGSKRTSRSALSRWIGALRPSRSGMMTSGVGDWPRSLI